jgi:alpha-L-rhamnosidase
VSQDRATFLSARPVWLPGREGELNLSVGFRAVFGASQPEPGTRAVLRVAAASLYRAFLNGEFVAHGPARGPHGFHRLDEWDVTARLLPGRNLLAVEVAGYNVNAYSMLDQPSFLQAELVCGGRVLASTAGAGARFTAQVLKGRVQKVQRYSFQRAFIEVWKLLPGFDRWRRQPGAALRPARLAAVGPKRLLPRRVPAPEFLLRQPVGAVSCGRVQTGLAVEKPWKDRSLVSIKGGYKGYPESDLELVPSLELQGIASKGVKQLDAGYDPHQPVRLAPNSFQILDLGTNLSGFPGATVTCRRSTRLYMIFDELLTPDLDVNFRRMDCVNAVLWELAPGTYDLEAFEPYTLRYLKLLALDGGCEVSGVRLRELAHPGSKLATFAAADERLNRLFAAARETFRQNSVDIFMDCPSRERAGWLCDSFFTARAALDLCGDTVVERNFYENYLLPPRFPDQPAGMLPMCYPAEHPDGNFIPNWALWFVLQLEEYLARSGDRRMVAALRRKVLALFDYFRPFRNSDGLLEKLQRWVFVEWSQAAKFVQDVNYPTNMLYAGALDAAARLYRLPRLAAEARRVRAAVRRQSFDGQFFVDNAVREGGRLRVTRNRSEVCQYFAFFFDVATPAAHPRLWRRLVEDFGPDRVKAGRLPEIHGAAPFIGNMLRLELLSRWGRAQQLLDESVGYLLYMAERTGTLWEVAEESASCNHGFASHTAHLLYRDVLGLARLDPVNRSVRLRFNDLKMSWCRGSVPVPGGAVGVEWRRRGRRIVYHLDAPAGYTLEVEGDKELELVRGR